MNRNILFMFDLLSINHTTACLVGGQYEHLRYLHMLWCIGGIYGNISNIIAS